MAVAEKMKQVLYPKYLLGGMMARAEGAEEQGMAAQVRGLVGRWPDADAVLQGGMSEGLRDWDLWYVLKRGNLAVIKLMCVTGDLCCSAYCCRSC